MQRDFFVLKQTKSGLQQSRVIKVFAKIDAAIQL